MNIFIISIKFMKNINYIQLIQTFFISLFFQIINNTLILLNTQQNLQNILKKNILINICQYKFFLLKIRVFLR